MDQSQHLNTLEQEVKRLNRELEIEASLERVRARTMAMQKSEELAETAYILFEQFKELGETPDQITIGIFDEAKNCMEGWITLDGRQMNRAVDMPIGQSSVIDLLYTSWKSQQKSLTIDLSGEELRQWLKFRKAMSQASQVKVDKPSEVRRIITAAYFTRGYLLFSSDSPPPPTSLPLLERFAGVFNLTYTRFLDLQKAEAQTREARIETALERVRSKTLAMHNSPDVTAATETMFDELKKLGSDNLRCGMANIHTNRTMDVFGITTLDGGSKMTGFGLFGMDEHPIWQRLFDSWLNKNDFVTFLAGKEKDEYFNNINSHRGYLPQQLVDFPDNYFHAYYFDQGIVWTYSLQPHSDLDSEIMKRFATVFSLTFRRYQDLRKAEAQAREAQIEASLERVRSKTMAMHNSEDVGDTLATLFEEFVKLDIKPNRCGIIILNDTPICDLWSAKTNPDGKASLFVGQLDLATHPLLRGIHDSWRNKNDKYLYTLEGDDLVSYYQAINDSKYYPTKFDLKTLPAKEFHSDYYFGDGSIFAFTKEPISTDAAQIFQRFAGVFGQTYRRYLDLQRAETQAKESQIQLALERVRARTMAMQHSSELAGTATEMFKQMQALGMRPWACGFNIFEKDEKTVTQWMTAGDGALLTPFTTPLTEEPFFIRISEARQRGEELFVMESGGKELEETYRYMFSLPATKKALGDIMAAGFEMPKFQISHCAFFSKGYLMFITYEPYPEAWDIFKRFAKVFEQTYTRFLDLQKAEEQAREAQIETSVERVRSQAMAMRTSEDLLKAAEVLRNEMIALKVEGFTGASFYMVDENDWVSMWDFSDVGNLGKPTAWRAHWDARKYAILGEFWRIWKDGVPYFVIKFGPDKIKKVLEEWYEVDKEIYSMIREAIEKGQLTTQWNVMGSMARGVLSLDVLKPPTEDTKQIVLKMTVAFDLAYQRFEDLKKAEAQALEAVKRASVDRIRAEIASMRTTGDLQKITPLIWSELTTLGIPFIRCGVFIMDEELKQIHTFLSTPDGKAIATLHLPFDFDLSLTINAIDHWRKKKIYTEHWDAAKFVQSWVKLSTLAETPASTSRTEAPPENLYLHMLPFLQGMLYVGNVEPLTEDMIHLLESVAEAFSTAYARYEDFNKLEAANSKIEKTLVDLKQTQTQLVQSEKMASLGELTAGIAHEIQNPLNFVNNFSEVNKELLVEMNDAIQKGAFDEAKVLAKDIIDNSEKITHHGKRADVIVKGMLQHSRASTGQKEPTDINVLADEYLRLAYHGLRAKDKSFNATTKTDFDSSIGTVNIIPQDIGRVILNLITNAFYAVNKKKCLNQAGYEPTVTVTTSTKNGKVEIRVTDNGIGIPPSIKDKIFQPFFTTKPTGQGTGLGLSMSYDIVKAHGGDIKVYTKENEGSEFVITLPS